MTAAADGNPAIDEHALAILTGPTIPELLTTAARENGGRPYASFFDGGRLTLAELTEAVNDARRGLAERGVGPGTRVAVMLTNHLDHVVLVHALIAQRAVWIPVNTRLRGESLRHLLTDSDPALLIIDVRFDAEISALGRVSPLGPSPEILEYRTDRPPPWQHHTSANKTDPPPARPDDVISVMYTSGTTGPAKGVQVTDRMLRAAALGAAYVSDPREGDVYFLWEPLCHVGGAQVLFLPLIHDVSLAFVDRFSASAFWRQVSEAGATHVHHLGGIIPMLLSRPASPEERDPRVRVSWGGGMTARAWRAAEQRFGIRVHECYGMTEASSISTVNTTGSSDGIGRPLPWFDVEIHDERGTPVHTGATGEIVVRPRVDGLITPGYFRNTAATNDCRRAGWWRTGDAGKYMGENLRFVGRLSDSVRHRGENVSAWEVESVLNAHPDVTESAVIGVEAAEGDEDIKAFVRPVDPAVFDPRNLLEWCRDRLAAFQLPRYVAVVTAFEKTPSLRIRKGTLPRTTSDSYDSRTR